MMIGKKRDIEAKMVRILEKGKIEKERRNICKWMLKTEQ